MGEFSSLGEYVGFLYGMKLDSKIMGTKFAYQKELNALEEWAKSHIGEYDDD